MNSIRVSKKPYTHVTSQEAQDWCLAILHSARGLALSGCLKMCLEGATKVEKA